MGGGGGGGGGSKPTWIPAAGQFCVCVGGWEWPFTFRSGTLPFVKQVVSHDPCHHNREISLSLHPSEPPRPHETQHSQ